MAELSHASHTTPVKGLGVTVLFLAAIALGSFLGLATPTIGESLSQGIDTTLMLMVGLLFFEVRLTSVLKAVANLRFIAIAWAANFLFVPMIAFLIASLFLADQPLLYLGLLIYFLAPCTDWFLGFTRMARGDTALGAALIPVNMLTQLLLFPIWLWLFSQHTGAVDFASIPNVLVQWFLLPFIIAQSARWLATSLLSATAFEKLCDAIGMLIPAVTAAVILQIFATNITTIAAHKEAFGLVLMAIFLFFVLTYLLAEGMAKLFKLAQPEQTLLAMTTAARNAPLMLALTAIAIPDQPLIYAALIIGTLVEFPHLTALKHVITNKRALA
ncbi:MAG: arsenic resistance protein [Pseudomonadota bacterium]